MGVRVSCGNMSDAMGSYTFSTKQFDRRIESNRGLLSTGCASRIARSKKNEYLRLCKNPDLVSRRKDIFRLTDPTV